MAVKQYSVDQLALSAGAIDLTKGAPRQGDFFTLSENNPTAALSAGVGLDVAVYIGDHTGTAQVTLYAASAANDLLGNILEQQKAEKRIVFFPLSGVDYNGREMFFSGEAFLSGSPTISYAADGSPTRQYTIVCPDLEIKPGGST